MKLSAIPFDLLKIGDRVESAIGTAGKITELIADSGIDFYEGSKEAIKISWENDGKSYLPHNEFDKVVWIE